MSTVLFVSLALTFAACFSLAVALGARAPAVTDASGQVGERKRRAWGRGPSIEQELAGSFVDRVIHPVVVRLSRLVRRVSPGGVGEKIKGQLALAGNPRGMTIDKFLAFKGLAVIAAALAFIPVLVAFPGIPRLYGLALLVVAGSFFLPNLWLRRRIDERQKAIRLALPDTLDLLTISVEAGLGFDSALSRVVDNTVGPLSEEFHRMLREIQLGTPRRNAFKALGERTNVQELRSFVLAMLQGEVFGISVGKVLRVQAHEMRIRRRQQAEEIAMKAPVKIVFPLVFCIFPALLVVILGPAALRIVDAMTRGL